MFFYSCFTEYLSIDGAIRVISDDFSISLLNPDSELYRYKADKYATMVRFFFMIIIGAKLLIEGGNIKF